jgi:hypothetical protein
LPLVHGSCGVIAPSPSVTPRTGTGLLRFLPAAATITGVKPAVSAATAIAVAAAASAAFQPFAEAADQRRYAPPGRMTDIGGRRMHILAAGEGTPAVVIVSALGTSVLEWVRIVRAVSARPRCVSTTAPRPGGATRRAAR